MRSRTVLRHASGMRYGKVRIDRRLVVDAPAMARWLGKWTVERIRELAARGLGREGAFPQLLDQTIERYEREGVPSRGTQSRLRRTGALLDGLQWSIETLGGDRWRVRVEGAPGQRHAIAAIDALRPFLGLSQADLGKALKAGPVSVPMKVQRGR